MQQHHRIRKRRVQYRPELVVKLNQIRVILGKQLTQRRFAQAVDVEPRTLRNWKARPTLKDFPKAGRPAHDERAHRRAFWKVGREYVRQGKGAGWRALKTAIGHEVPTRLIQTRLRELKRCEKRHERRQILQTQVRVDVTARNALWVQDSAQLARDPRDGSKIEAQVIKDRGPLVTVGLSTGAPARGQDVVHLLDLLKRTRGLPLVLGSDNGSPFVSEEAKAYLRREKVIHLRSLPRTPEHNGSAEIGIAELKRCSGLQAALQMLPEAAHARVVRAALRLNQFRIRTSKGLKTGSQLDETFPESYHRVERDRFYQECSSGIEQVQQRYSNTRERRMAEREVIYRTLERYGLVKRYRGGSRAATKAEIFS